MDKIESFSDLEHIDNRDMQKILARSEINTIADALCGATDSLREKFLNGVSRRNREVITEEIERAGLASNEGAQRRTLEIAQDLEEMGEIALTQRSEDELKKSEEERKKREADLRGCLKRTKFNRYNLEAVMAAIVRLSEIVYTEGPISLETVLDDIDERTLACLLQLAVDGATVEMVQEIGSNFVRIELHREELYPTILSQGIQMVLDGEHPRTIAERLHAVFGLEAFSEFDADIYPPTGAGEESQVDLRKILKDAKLNRHNLGAAIEVMMGIAKQARRDGVLSLEDFLSDISDRTLKYLFGSAIDGIQPDLLREIASYLVQAELGKLQLYFTIVSGGVATMLRGEQPRMIQEKLAAILGREDIGKRYP